MSSPLKSMVAGLLRPVARLTDGPAESLRRAWAHARLASRIEGELPASAIVLGTPEIHGTRRIHLGERLFLYPGLYLETQERGRIEIGDDVVISRGTHLVSFSELTIGAGTMIGEYASVRDANHRRGTDRPLREAGHEARAIRIGRQVWIGRGVMVLPGVTIGDGAVVGANAVVSHDVPAGALVAGIPARALARRNAA